MTVEKPGSEQTEIQHGGQEPRGQERQGQERQGRGSRHPEPRAESGSVAALNRILLRSLRALGEAGQADLACRMAAEAWSLLRRNHPVEAERHNGLLHYLTNPGIITER